MSRRYLVLSAFFAITGVFFTARSFPALRPLQILLPFIFGLAAGVALGRALPGLLTRAS